MQQKFLMQKKFTTKKFFTKKIFSQKIQKKLEKIEKKSKFDQKFGPNVKI
jgi:hypothetical protein